MPIPVPIGHWKQRRSVPTELHWQLAVSMDETRSNPLGFARDVRPQPALRHFIEQHRDLQLGQPRTDAAMDAVAERQMASSIEAIDDDAVRVREHALVAIGAEIPEDHL